MLHALLKRKRSLVLLGGFLGVVLVFFVVMSSLPFMLLWDENVYLGNARLHVGESHFTEDFRFPLLEWIIAAVWAVTGENLFVARVIIILFTLAAIALVYAIGREYGTSHFSLLLSVVFALSPLVLFWGFKVYTDIPAIAFVLLAFYLLLKKESLRKSSFIFILAGGGAAALAFLLRFPLLLFAGTVVGYYLVKKDWRIVSLFTLAFLVTITPWMVYNQRVYGNPVWDLQEQYSVIKQWTSPEPVRKQVLNFFVFTNFTVPFLFVGGFRLLRSGKKLDHLVLAYIIVSFVYYLFFVNMKDARYYISFLPFVCLVAVRGLYDLKRLRQNIFPIALVLLFLGVVISLIFVGGDLARRYQCEKESSTMMAVDYLRGKVSPGAVILSNAWPWFGYHLNVRAVSFWDEDLMMLVKLYNPAYAIYNDRIGIEYKREKIADAFVLEKEFLGACEERTLVFRKKDASF